MASMSPISSRPPTSSRTVKMHHACSVLRAADLHESSLRTYKVTPGSKAGSGATVAVARLPAVAKQSRRPFAGSDISLQLLSEGEHGPRPRSELS